MKHLYIILLCLPLIGFGQWDTNTVPDILSFRSFFYTETSKVNKGYSPQLSFSISSLKNYLTKYKSIKMVQYRFKEDWETKNKILDFEEKFLFNLDTNSIMCFFGYDDDGKEWINTIEFHKIEKTGGDSIYIHESYGDDMSIVFNSKHNVIKIDNYKNRVKTEMRTYKYDINNNIEQMMLYRNGKLSQITRNIFDSTNRIIQSNKIDHHGDTDTTHFYYDEEEKTQLMIVGNKSYYYDDENNLIKRVWEGYGVTEYYYDDENNLIKSEETSKVLSRYYERKYYYNNGELVKLEHYYDDEIFGEKKMVLGWEKEFIYETR